jgi:hypothetical protein
MSDARSDHQSDISIKVYLLLSLNIIEDELLEEKPYPTR